MTTRLRLAVTADLHWGIRPRGDEATRLLVSFLEAHPPDVLILAGDIGAGDEFGPCLQLFAALPCRKAIVPGNHDVWVSTGDPRGDSLRCTANICRPSAERTVSIISTRDRCFCSMPIWPLSDR